MLAAARKVLVTRPGLWVVTGLCALLVALPLAVAVTYGASGGVAFLLTGDAGLALEIWERTPGLSAGLIAVGAALLVAGFFVWARLYAMAIWMSRPEEEVPWRGARAATAGLWRRVAWVHLQSYALSWIVAVVLFLVASAAGPASFGTLVLLAALGFALAGALLRVVRSIALRAAVLDGLGSVMAWRSAVRFVRASRHEVAVTWVGLVAIGVSVWITGRLITPVLQDTAYDYPSTSGYEIARQLVQLLVSVPLETALFAFGIAAWTALYDGVEAPGRQARQERAAGDDPWLRRALAAGVVLALAGNGLPTLIDDRFAAAQAKAEARVAERDVKPEDALEASPPARPPGGERTSYDVEAVLDGDELAWTTRIGYVNDTGEPVRDVGIHLYANAYTRELRDIPFARDLITSDFNGEFQALAEPGESRRLEVSVAGRPVRVSADDTSTVVDLPAPLEPGERIAIEIDMAMTLPRYPERFGRWDDITLLGNWIPVVAAREEGSWRLDPFESVGDPFFSAAGDYVVSIRVDENTGVVGTGTLTSVERHADGTRAWTFEAPGVRDAAFAIGSFLRGLEMGTEDGLMVRSWYLAGEGARGEANLEAAVSAATDFSERYGLLPWTDVDVVETEGRLGGMEYPGTVFVSSGAEAFAGLPLLPDSGFEEARARYVVGHELAHQWWYATVGSDQIREPWLDEAPAEASTRIWLLEEDDGERTWLMTNLTPDAIPSRSAVGSGIDDFAGNEAYTEAIYLRGSEVLMELRRRVGGDVYDEIMRTWHRMNRLGIGTVAEFASLAIEVGGDGAAEVVEEYFPSGGG
jgi:hypothetical protein